MTNFFEKLKKTMGVEEVEEKPKETEIKKEVKKTKKIEIEKPKKEKTILIKDESKIKKETPQEVSPLPSDNDKWLEPEGELAVDVYQTESELVIISAIAGVKKENLEISFENDVLTIEGERKKPLEEKGEYFSQECYWGKFSRKIILPTEIDPNKIEASFKDGILMIRMPKVLREKKRTIKLD